MAGGPSQIATWDPKPDRPLENRGPFGTKATRIPSVRICEHLAKMAAMLDRFTLVRSVDAQQSNHDRIAGCTTQTAMAPKHDYRHHHYQPANGR
jgi:hypothetical protein